MKSEFVRPSPASIETLENRQLLAAVALESKIKVAMLTDEVTGEALNSSRITVRFSENMTLADPSKFRMFGYAVNPASGSGTAQQKVTINLLNMREGSDGNKLVFETDRRVRKGARFYVYDGAITNGAGEQSVLLPKGLNKERYTLASRAFTPTDLSYFNQTLYSAAPATTDTPNQPSSGSVLADLTSFLDQKIAAGNITAQQKQTALDQFNDATNQSTVPSANLRAAIVSLVGTVAAPAVTHLLGTDNVTGQRYTVIDFSTEVSGSAVVAETKGNPSTGRLRTLIKPDFAGESFQSLGAILAHESLHQDIVGATPNLPNGQNEEIFTNSVETYVYAQHLLIRPGIASSDTALVNRQNGMLLAMLNSGDALFPRVGTLQGPILGSNIFPGGNSVTGGSYTSFENYIRRIFADRNFADVNTTAPDLARQMKNNIRGTTDTAAFSFNTTQIEQFDNSQQIITDRAAVQLAAALKLQVTK